MFGFILKAFILDFSLYKPFVNFSMGTCLAVPVALEDILRILMCSFSLTVGSLSRYSSFVKGRIKCWDAILLLHPVRLIGNESIIMFI